MDEFMPEAFTMPIPDMIRELQDMGVEQTLISHAEADPRLLAGLYLYVHVEALNMPDPYRDADDDDEGLASERATRKARGDIGWD